jgi:hypothetical protein
MAFDDEVFISYAHLDNVELVAGTDGWVTNLHKALAVRLAQLLGQESRIWRDPKLQGNDIFGDVLVERLRSVAALLSVVSPAYIKSEWCRKEVAEFCKACGGQGGIRVGDKARLFKVLKTPVPLEQHPEALQHVLGYEFFKTDRETGKVTEFYKIFGEEAERDFWVKLFDLAQDVCNLLGLIESTPQKDAKRAAGAVYLALTTADLDEPRSAIRRDLEEHGYTVLPSQPYAGDAAALRAAIQDDLARSRLSIQMIGRRYGLVPEGATESLAEIQNALAVERAKSGGFSRLIWIPPDLQVEDDRQRKVIEKLRMDPDMPSGSDVLERPFEDLRTLVTAWLAGGVKPEPAKVAAAAPARSFAQLYFVYDPRDAAAIGPWTDFFFKEFEVIHPVLQGDEAEIRNAHEDSLRNADGVLIFYGAASEFWLRQKLREVKKSAGYGRTKPMPAVGVCVIPPKTPEKDRFETHDAMVLVESEGFSPAPLQPFVALLKGDGSTGHGDAAEPAV